MIVLANHLARLERVDGLPRMVIRDLRDGREWTVKFDEEAYSLGMSEGYEFDAKTIRFTYSSPTTPQRIYDLDLDTGERVLRKEQEVPSGHDPADYVTRRIFATALSRCFRCPHCVRFSRSGLQQVLPVLKPVQSLYPRISRCRLRPSPLSICVRATSFRSRFRSRTMDRNRWTDSRC